MTTMNNVIKWFKEKTKKPPKIVRQLPALPPGGASDEYGFRMKEHHIYEEILPEDVEDPAEVFLENADVSQAAAVGPYLVVPIAGSGRRNSLPEEEDDDSVFLADASDSGISSNTAGATYDQCNSLYNAIPSWMRQNMKQSNRKRHGIAVTASKQRDNQSPIENRKPARRKSTDAILNPASGRLRCGVRSHSASSVKAATTAPTCGHAGNCTDAVCNEELQIDDIYQRSNELLRGVNECNTNKTSMRRGRGSESDFSFSEYDLSDAEMHNILSEKEYEYYLIKAEKNFQLERELKRSIDGGGSSCSEYPDEYGSVDSDAQEYCQNCNDKRSRQNDNYKCCKGCNVTLKGDQRRRSQRGMNISQAMILVPKNASRRPPVHHVNGACHRHKKTVSWCSLESLNSSNYSSASSSSNRSDCYNAVNMDAYYSRDVTNRISSRNQSATEKPEISRNQRQRSGGDRAPAGFSRSVSDRLSCRASASPSGLDSDNMYGSIYESSNFRQNRMLADVMKRNHDRQLMML
ncbi:uncharacterized protein LOC141907440 [Tubulanus polymorphus]|uniref:uncharacterized protein LOC141907440 n=1 Tax=Tubulanus polymorphus TaxID=672921 RepID=UPI003DA275AA